MNPPESSESTAEHVYAQKLADLFRALESPLLGFAFQMVKDEQIAQDIVQDAFIRLQANFVSVEQPKAWLYTTTRRLAIDHLRRASKVVPFTVAQKDDETTPSSQDPEDTRMTPDVEAEYHERTGLMRVCIERLEPRAQALVKMKFIENLSYKQISERMGMTVSNVGYTLHHALKSLELELNKEGIAQ
ncbi:MAG: RNA polymerase sigma factor [Opitutaceae bacterium]